VPPPGAFPLGATVTVEQLDVEPHPVLARLRQREPVSWLPALGGWLITRHDLALEVMRDPITFTVDDPRFSTAQVIGPSMLSLDGGEHARHRAPFVGPFRPVAVREQFAHSITAQAERLLDELRPHGWAELRRSFAGPLAASIITGALGLETREAAMALGWYDAIVGAVTSITAGESIPAAGASAFAALSARLTTVIEADDSGSSLGAVAAKRSLSVPQIVANAAVVLFGGIETAEGMIANAALHLLERPQLMAAVRGEPSLLESAIEESLRLEPAASVVDRYATKDTTLAAARVSAGDLVRVSIAAANRDPSLFEQPDRFDLHRTNAGRHVSFAQGPHVCLGIHLARLEARTALGLLLARLPGLRLDSDRPAEVRGLVFRKPRALHVLWENSRSHPPTKESIDGPDHTRKPLSQASPDHRAGPPSRS
jgi:cytochrome P450